MTRLPSRFLLFAALFSLPVDGEGQNIPPAVDPPVASQAASAIPDKPSALPGAPALGRLRVFEDWAVGCDNHLMCSAVSLLPEGKDQVNAVLVWIDRAGGPDGQSRIELVGADDLEGEIELLIDNEAVGRMVATDDRALARGPEAFRLIRRMGSSYSLEIRRGPSSVASPSLGGLAQALRYMDEQQGRVGSEAALAAIGDKPASLARTVPGDGEPVAVAVPASDPDEPEPLSESELQAARVLATCDGRMRRTAPVSILPMDAERSLVLVACDSATDNVSSVALIASGPAGRRTFRLAAFDLMPGFVAEPGTLPLLVNAHWDPRQGTLTSLAHGRPLGDCGTNEIYRWDGSEFRLVEARAMPVCRGAWLWPVLWSAAPG